jgi:hypothetical protein
MFGLAFAGWVGEAGVVEEPARFDEDGVGVGLRHGFGIACGVCLVLFKCELSTVAPSERSS